MGIALALLSSVLWGIGDFAGGTASRRLPALLVVFASQAVGLAAAALIALGAGAWSSPIDYLPWAIGAGLVGATGLVTFYQALAVGTMGVVSPIAALGVVVPVAVGLLTGHWPPLLVGVGIVLAIFGVVGASGPERSAGRSLAPVALAVIAAVCFGVTLLLIARGAQTSPLMTMVAMRISSVLPLGLLWVALRRRLARVIDDDRTGAPSASPAGRVWLVVAAAGLFDVSANLMFALASTASALAIVAILGSLYPAATVLLARIVHGELLTRIQQAGVAVALVGVALIAGWS